MAYDKQDYDYAKKMLLNQPAEYQKILIIMHGIISFMKFEINHGIDLLLLANAAKS